MGIVDTHMCIPDTYMRILGSAYYTVLHMLLQEGTTSDYMQCKSKSCGFVTTQLAAVTKLLTAVIILDAAVIIPVTAVILLDAAVIILDAAVIVLVTVVILLVAAVTLLVAVVIILLVAAVISLVTVLAGRQPICLEAAARPAQLLHRDHPQAGAPSLSHQQQRHCQHPLPSCFPLAPLQHRPQPEHPSYPPASHHNLLWAPGPCHSRQGGAQWGCSRPSCTERGHCWGPRPCSKQQ